MDYFTMSLLNFWVLIMVVALLDSQKALLICVTKMNEGLTGLDQHEGE